jgi:hypothetical protein
MWIPARAELSVAAILAALTSCAAQGSPEMTSDSGGGAGAPAELGITFDAAAPLMLEPRESRIVGVTVDPPGDHLVRFALLDDGEGTPGDASLDATERRTDLTGRAEITLTAPSVPAAFLLRASVDSITQTLPVAVDASGLTSLTVVPRYSDNREISRWIASAHEGATCAQVKGTPPEDGPYTAQAPFGQSPRLEHVPVGVSLAVTLRAGQFAGGCTTLERALEGESNRVTVDVINRPIQLPISSVDLVFSVDGPNDAARAAFEAVIESSLAAIFMPETSDVEALLDEMEATLEGAERTAFRSARGAAAWDSRLETTLGEAAVDFLRLPLTRFLAQGLSSGRDDLVEAQIEAAGGPEDASVELLRVADGTPEEAGFLTEFDARWQADAADNVLIGTSFSFSAPALLVALAKQPAIAEVPASSSVAGALATLAPCSQIADVLVEYGQADGVSYTGCGANCSCDLECTLALCEAGITSLVQRFADLDATQTSSIEIAATGRAVVGTNAELEGLSDGSWVGNLDVGSSAAQLSGSLRSSTE